MRRFLAIIVGLMELLAVGKAVLQSNQEWLLLDKEVYLFIAVAFWTVLTTIMLNLRLAYAAVYRLGHGPLHSWLSEDDVATGPNARSYAIFGATSVARD